MTFSRHPVRIGRLRAFHFRHDAISSFVAERIKDEGETADKALDAALAGFLQGFEVVIIQLDENDDAQEIFASFSNAPHVTMEIPNPKPGTPKSWSYGFGWGLVKFDWATKPLLTHNGSNSMNLATILVHTENDLGITIDTNFPGDKADAGLMELTEMLYKKFGPMPASP